MTYLTKSPALWTCSIMLVPSNMAEFLFQKSKNKFNSKFKSLFLSWVRKTCCRRGRKHVQEAVELLGSPKKLFVLNFFLNKPISVEEILCRHKIECWLVQKSSYDCCCCALENIYVGWQEREGPDSGRRPPVAICFFVIWHLHLGPNHILLLWQISVKLLVYRFFHFILLILKWDGKNYKSILEGNVP